MKAKTTKTFRFGASRMMYGTARIEVPEGFTFDEAMEHVLENRSDAELPRGECAPDSDKPGFQGEDCGFAD